METSFKGNSSAIRLCYEKADSEPPNTSPLKRTVCDEGDFFYTNRKPPNPTKAEYEYLSDEPNI